MIRGAALDPIHSNHRAAGGGGTIRAARLALAALLLLGGCASGKAPALGERDHVVIGYGAGGARTLLLQPVPGGRLSSTFGARQGEVIGHVGTSGRSTGPQLHYEILVQGTPVDPFAVGPSLAQATKAGRWRCCEPWAMPTGACATPSS